LLPLQSDSITTIKAIVLSIIIIVVMGCGLSGNTDFSDLQNRKIENLKTFSKLYGYVRYFYPSDEAASIDWDKFLYYGIEQVVKAKNSVALKNTLDSLFLPIAPSIDIFFAGETPEEFDQADNIDDLVLVSWQHRGVKANPNPMYKSIRLGRIDRIENWSYGIYRYSKMYDFDNKKFKLSAKVRTSGNSKGEIDILGFDNSGSGKYYYRAKTFENEEWEQFILEDEFDESISRFLVTIRLKEKGKIFIDDLEFQLEKSEDNLQPFSIANDQNWNGNGLAYKYNVEKSENKTSIIIQSTEEFEYNSLFKEHGKGNELITKELGSGIKCRFPIALYLPREKPEKFSQLFIGLKNKLDQVQLEVNTAQQEVTRIGAVITAWNIFQHFYPYFDVVQTDWDSVLLQTLIDVQDNQDERDCLITLRQITAALQDGHARVMHSSEGKFKALPAIFDYLEDQIVIVSTNSDQLQKGDIILELDGESARQLLFDCEKTESGSPQWKKQRALRSFTADDSTKISDVKIRRGEQILRVSINRKLPLPEYDRPDNVSEIKDNIYYVNLDKATIQEIESQIQEISKAKGVVFDLRGYPNGNVDVISYMIDHSVHSPKWNYPHVIYPDQERIVYDSTGRWTIEPQQPRIQGKIVFLTNKSAISYAESFMGIIEHYKLAEIIGSTTAGANGNINTVTTMGGFEFRWTGMKVLKHDDSQHHLVGIKPTIPMEPTIKGIREGRDELLERAIEIISK
jgi:hypothetical protein